MTRIAFPSLPELLLPSQDLVDLQLHETPGAGYFSPEAFANALSGMTQLRTLSFHLLSFPRRRSFLSVPPPPGERILLPALTQLKYRGISKYLDSLAARIDAPRLGDIDITLFSQPTMDAFQFGRFIERIGLQAPLSRGTFQISVHAISISFANASTSSPLRLQISCKQLDWQLSCMAQICHQFSPFLFRVENLGINMIDSSSGYDGVDGDQWLELVLAFSGAKDIRVTGEVATRILRAFPPANGSNETVLPALRHICVEDLGAISEASWDALQDSQRLSGHPVELQGLCHIYNANFIQMQELRRHLVDKHAYQFEVVCLYCGDFECEPKQRHLFREHIASKHPEVARNDALISGPTIYSSQLHHFVNRHSFLRAKGIVASSTTVIANS